jgi:hypothetical protein
MKAPQRVLRSCARWPDWLACPTLQVLTMPPADVAVRLVLLKDLLPGSDVARMVELAPG